jgi:hypothetical protein
MCTCYEDGTQMKAQVLLFETFMKFGEILMYVLVAPCAVDQIVSIEAVGDRHEESYLIKHSELLDSEYKNIFM